MAPPNWTLSSGRGLTAHGDDFVTTGREHVDGQTADTTRRAGHDNRAAGRCLSVVLHAVDRQPRGESRRTERHGGEFIEPRRHGNYPVAFHPRVLGVTAIVGL